MEAIDLFCGVGGLSYGLQKARIKIVGGLDLDPACRYPFEKNIGAKFLEGDIADVTGTDLNKLFSKNSIRLLAGCAPCQPFSTFTHGRNTRSDSKWGLLYQFSRLIQEITPELVTMENVPRIKLHEVFDDFIAQLKRNKYVVDTRIVYCPQYGIPQQRKRLVLIASRIGAITFIPPTHKTSDFVTVKSAIGHLPRLSAGATDPNDPLHKARTLTPINLKRVKKSTPGGTWNDWPPDLRAACHKSSTGASFKSVYSRMEWTSPSPTITTQCFNFGTGRFGHPQQNRAISLREAAILQTFPNTFIFVENGRPISFSTIGRLIGNAVPPRLGQVIGASLQKSLNVAGEK